MVALPPRRVAALAAFLAAALVAALPAAAAAAPVHTAPCNVASRSRCGSLLVRMDHSGRTPGTQAVGFAVLPATGRARGTLAVLVGGPGQASTPIARGIAASVAPLRRSYDLLLVDQRGTGRSGALRCSGLAASSSSRAVTACGNSLGARRPFYTTREDAADLEDVRSALGVDRLSILGISYGTRIAGVYARLFPRHLGRIVLDSAAPYAAQDVLGLLRDLAFPRVLRLVCFPPGCGTFLARDPVDSVVVLARRLARRALRGTVVLPGGQVRHAALTTSLLFSLVSSSDLDPFVRTALPSAVASALSGDANPLLRLALVGGGSQSSGINVARFLATTCVEAAIPWDPAAPAATRARELAAYLRDLPAAAFSPFDRATVLAFTDALPCLAWPATPRPAAAPTRAPRVPVLVLSGSDDLRTPTESAREIAAQYPESHFVRIVNVGHSVLASDASGCALRTTADFLDGRAIPFCRVGRRFPPLFPYVPATVSAQRAPIGLSGLVGRTSTAVLATLLDANRHATEALESGAVRAGGLRGGTLTITRRALILRRYSFVRGVAVTATVPLRSRRYRVTVSGPAAARGTLVFQRVRGGRRASGILGGTRIVLRVPAADIAD